MRFTTLSALLFVQLVAGCAESASFEGDDETVDVDDGKGDGFVHPLGDYETNDHGASVFNRVVLESNKTFNVLVGGGGEMSGNYHFTSSPGGRNRYIVFADSRTGETVARCGYTIEGDVLKLSPAAVLDDAITCDESTLTRVTDHAWCEQDADCSLQGLAPPHCHEEPLWTCDSGCTFSCR